MNFETTMWLWILAVSCMQLIPWTIDGISNIFQKSSDPAPTSGRKSFFRSLFQNQISILFSVPLGIYLIVGFRQYGILPSLAIHYYLIAPFVGIFLVVLGAFVYKYLALALQRISPRQLDHDIKQYSNNTGSLFRQKLWQKLLLGFCNGFSEEMLMRVFVMGLMIHHWHLHPILAIAITLILNGIHHTNQGRILGSLSVMIIQAFYAVSYLVFNDFLFIALMHVSNDVAGMFAPAFISWMRNKRV